LFGRAFFPKTVHTFRERAVALGCFRAESLHDRHASRLDAEMAMILAPEQAGFLQALAQIAVAFAGFAGVIGAFSRFSTDVRVTAFRVRGMVALSLAALLIALAPFAAEAFGATPELAWRGVCGFAALVAALLFASLLKQVMLLFREKLLHTQALNVLWYGLAGVMIASLGAVTLGILPLEQAWSIYALGVIFLIVLCAYNFLMIILSVSLDRAP
jgi:hypothetical protein